MSMKSSQKSGGAHTYLFGSFVVQHDRERQSKKLRVNFPRLISVGLLALVLVYAGIVVCGYTWLSHFRKLEQITVSDVALIRWKQVRRNIAAQQFKTALAEWQAGKFQSAFLAFSTALRNDPDSIDGRLQAADFFSQANAVGLAVNVLKDGLQRQPRNLQLIEKTFDLLTATSREREALALLRGPLAGELNGPNGATLRTYELLAVLGAEGPAAAQSLLAQYPDLRQRAASGVAVSRVLWVTKERFAAIDALKAYIRERANDYSGYALLAQYLEAAGMIVEARETADLACVNIPNEIAPRILRIGTLSPITPTDFRRWGDEIKTYLMDFRAKPESLGYLAELAGRKGWVDLARALYDAGLTLQLDGRVLALHYVDALLQNSRTNEAKQILDDLDLQTEDVGSFSTLLRQRQVEVAAAGADRDGAREGAKRLASALHQDPDRLEFLRRRFELLGAMEAAAEMKSALSSVRLVSKK